MAEDDLGLPIADSPNTRAIAAEARLLSKNPAFLKAAEELDKAYMTEFRALNPKDPDYAMQCMRAQIVIGVIGDVVSQVALLADHQKVDAARTRGTIKGTK